MKLNELQEAASFIKSQGVESPEIGIVLGTGLGNLVTEIDIIKEISYEDIPGFPVSTVETHSGKLIFGKIKGKTVLAMQGRFHFYEGYKMHQVVFPVRVMKLLGVQYLLISNACGGLNLDWNQGDLMMLTDHINLFPDNPLHGPNEESLGTRFPDMSQAYSSYLNGLIREVANEQGILLREGTYITAQGPMLETPAEYRMLRNLGGDVVGMSTVPEVIAANHIGLPCCCISVITDECDPDNLKPVDIAEIIEVAGRSEKILTKIYVGLIDLIAVNQEIA